MSPHLPSAELASAEIGVSSRAGGDRLLVWLCALTGLLAFVAAGVGVLAGGGEPRMFTTVQGETVQLYGQGVYRHDSLIAGSGSRGVDAVTLLLGIPLLAGAMLRHRRGSLRAAMLLSAVLTYFLYLYASRALHTAYNELFLVYVAAFSASMFALVVLLRSMPPGALAPLAGRLPRRSVAAFLFVLAGVLVLAWLPPVLGPLVAGRPAEVVEHYTTFVTGALDLGVLLPTALVAAVLVLRHRAEGYLIAVPLAGFTSVLGPALIAMTAAQVRAGVTMSPTDAVVFVASFLVLSAFAAWTLTALLRRLPKAADASRLRRAGLGIAGQARCPRRSLRGRPSRSRR